MGGYLAARGLPATHVRGHDSLPVRIETGWFPVALDPHSIGSAAGCPEAYSDPADKIITERQQDQVTATDRARSAFDAGLQP